MWLSIQASLLCAAHQSTNGCGRSLPCVLSTHASCRRPVTRAPLQRILGNLVGGWMAAGFCIAVRSGVGLAFIIFAVTLISSLVSKVCCPELAHQHPDALTLQHEAASRDDEDTAVSHLTGI